MMLLPLLIIAVFFLASLQAAGRVTLAEWFAGMFACLILAVLS